MSSNRVIVITGGNTGIGYEAVKAFAQSSEAYSIVLAGRSLQKAQQAAESLKSEVPETKSTIETVQVDLEDDSSIQKAFDYVSSKHGRVDALVNNAGAQFDLAAQSGKYTMREAWNKSWDTNTTGTQIVTHTFVPLLLKSSDPRLLFVTSGTSTLTETANTEAPINKSPEKGWPKSSAVNPIAAYRSSKAGMNMMMREWNRILKADGVKVWCISPGFLATNLGGDPEMVKKLGAGSPALGGHFIKDVVEGQRDSDTGKVIRRDGEIQPW